MPWTELSEKNNYDYAYIRKLYHSIVHTGVWQDIFAFFPPYPQKKNRFRKNDVRQNKIIHVNLTCRILLMPFYDLQLLFKQNGEVTHNCEN